MVTKIQSEPKEILHEKQSLLRVEQRSRATLAASFLPDPKSTPGYVRKSPFL